MNDDNRHKILNSAATCHQPVTLSSATACDTQSHSQSESASHQPHTSSSETAQTLPVSPVTFRSTFQRPVPDIDAFSSHSGFSSRSRREQCRTTKGHSTTSSLARTHLSIKLQAHTTRKKLRKFADQKISPGPAEYKGFASRPPTSSNSVAKVRNLMSMF